jgi:exopolyphosphatase / guanosine-5'-triphosphate,3'-diphosphate pyrophosphatase
MKLAAIDIGTNSTRLLIEDYRNNKFFPLERKMEITRLGRGLNDNNTISEDSAKKTLDTLIIYGKLMKKNGVKKYRAVGTSALRRASNSREFVSMVEENPGISVDIVGESEEARLSFYGAVKGVGLDSVRSSYKSESKILVVDVGGGSSEFILGDINCNTDLIESVGIGCVNLSEKYIDSDVPDAGRLNKMHYYVRGKVNGTISKIKNFKIGAVIGVAGTITTLAAIDLELDKYNSEMIHGHVLSLKRIDEIYKFLCGLNLEDRKKVAGVDAGRADVIIGGVSIIIEVLELLGYKYINVSEKDILDGIIYTLVDF